MKKNHIMVVDDSEMDQFIAKKILVRNNAANTITSVFSAEDALTFLDAMIYAGEPFPEIIFLAMEMKDMNGFEFLEKYSRYFSKHRKATSVYILSAFNDPEYLKRAIEIPFVKKYLNKPLTDALALNVLEEAKLSQPLVSRNLHQFYVKS